MKHLLFALISLVLFACSEKGSEEANDLSEFTFTIIDTLFVDPGEEMLYAGYGSGFTEFDDKKQFLYNYNPMENSIEIIDLDQLKLVQKIKFDEEGPDGTGANVNTMAFNGQNKILLTTFNHVSLFDTEARRLASYKMTRENFLGDTLLAGETVTTDGLLDDQEEYFITSYHQGLGEPLGIAKIRLDDYTLKKIPVPRLKELAKFRLIFSGANTMAASYAGIYLARQDEKVLISNNAVNELYTYDPGNDTVRHYSYSSRLTSNSKKRNEKVNVDSNEEFQKMMKENSKDVSFGRFVYDGDNQRYYRFSHKFVKEGAEENIYQPVLTIFDQNLNQIFETEELPLEKTYWRYFVKDGKLYLFENIRDEMAFIVMEVEEK